MSTTSSADHRQNAALEIKAAINAATNTKEAMNLAVDRGELVVCWYFARYLARLPGKMDHDHQQIPLILADLSDWYKRGDLARDEALVCYAKSRAKSGRLVSVQEFKKLEPRETVDLVFWRGVLLTRAACKRYVYRSSLSGAISLRQEWFADHSSPRIEEPDHVVAQLATWIFEQHSQPPLTYTALEKRALQNADQMGRFKARELRTAYRLVYTTAKERPPKTGWPLREPYKTEWADKQKKSRFSRGTLNT